eukprot:scaffold18052_cov28-Tisochrysis_lutea.AAC.2
MGGELRSTAHSRIFETTPAPTVLPPSRNAKRMPSCSGHADGWGGEFGSTAYTEAIEAAVLPARPWVYGACDVGCAEEELRAVVGEEGRVAAALFLGERVDRRLELGDRLDGSRLAEHLRTPQGGRTDC